MACTTCFNGCGTPVPDGCVKYTGPDNELLDIETSDPLKKVLTAIINQLQGVSEGTEILLEEFDTTCTLLNSEIGTSKKLDDIIQGLATAICSINDKVVTIEEEVEKPFVINTGCLTVSDPTRDGVLQATVNKLCAVSALLDSVAADYVKATQLNTLIQQYLDTINDETGPVQENTKMSKYIAYEYYGPLSNFDSSGKGLASAGYDKVYICNGQNGTPDKRGRVAVGAVQGVPGGSLDPAVDPAQPYNSGTNYALNDKFGSNYETLALSQIPPHTHAIVDPGHTHSTSVFRNDSQGGNQVNTLYLYNDTGAIPVTIQTQSSTTGITINSTGGGQPINNRQPSIAAYYIMYIP